MKLNNDLILNDMGIKSLNQGNKWLTHSSLKYNCQKSSLLNIADSLQWKPNNKYEIINENDILSQIIDLKTRDNLSIIFLRD